jgi:hypothetical protein
MIIPPKGYTAIRLPLRLIERDFWSARHTVTFALWAQLAYVTSSWYVFWDYLDGHQFVLRTEV